MKVEMTGIIDGVRRDRFGAWKIILEVPMGEATKAAALGTMVETVFKLTFEPQDNEKDTEQNPA